MICIIVEAKTNTGELPNMIFYRFAGKPALTRLLASCVRCEYAQKIILAMPSSDKGFIHGHLFQDAMAQPQNISYNDRAVVPIFHGRHNEDLDRLYYAALNSGAQTIVRIGADNPLIPAWLLNSAADYYVRNLDGRYLRIGNPEYNDGFSFEIFPFWMLASAHINCDSQQGLTEYLKNSFGVELMKNVDPNHIPNAPQSLRFDDRSKVGLLDGLFEEIDRGADIGDLVKDLMEAGNEQT